MKKPIKNGRRTRKKINSGNKALTLTPEYLASKNTESIVKSRRNETFITKLMLSKENFKNNKTVNELYSKIEDNKKKIFNIIKKYETYNDSIKKLNNSLDNCLKDFKSEYLYNFNYIIFEINSNNNLMDEIIDKINDEIIDKFSLCYDLKVNETLIGIIDSYLINETEQKINDIINDITKLIFNYHKNKINMLLIMLFEVKYLINIKDTIIIKDEDKEKIIIGKSLNTLYDKMYNILIFLKKIKKEEFKNIITNIIEKKTQKQLQEPSLIITGEPEKKPSNTRKIRGPSTRIIRGPKTRKQQQQQ